MKNNINLIFYTLLSILFFGCAVPAKVYKADIETEAQAVNFEVSGDKGKIYFIAGVQTFALYDIKMKMPMDIFVDNNNIGSMNSEDVMVFEIQPGLHDFSWNPRHNDPLMKNTKMEPLTIDVQPENIYVLQGDLSPGGGAAFGLIGAAIAPPTTHTIQADKEKISGLNVVIPQNCGSIC